VARVLIVGCGCRGVELARSLMAEGHAVRGTTRRPERAQELRALGIDPWVGDPDRVGSLVYAQDNVTVLCWLLGRVPSVGDSYGRHRRRSTARCGSIAGVDST
jgi:uncharacterized protein YbjT (DUF2867 family)